MFYLPTGFGDEPMRMAQAAMSAPWIAARFYTESYWRAYTTMMEDLMAIAIGEPLVEGIRDTRAIRTRAAERVFG